MCQIEGWFSQKIISSSISLNPVYLLLSILFFCCSQSCSSFSLNPVLSILFICCSQSCSSVALNPVHLLLSCYSAPLLLFSNYNVVLVINLYTIESVNGACKSHMRHLSQSYYLQFNLSRSFVFQLNFCEQPVPCHHTNERLAWFEVKMDGVRSRTWWTSTTERKQI